ncbi:hypothetical protein LARI1_G009372 [Lachnellula arida]|uniref:Uncharacterized protein n=1 Tax=Lachnellula arida TaxID=1316785 RepID=A0A8T9B0V7_9HELO|nr:hypothetical protein LARI1_G009372 [Lachnellula arida]
MVSWSAPKNIQYLGAACGTLSSVLFFFSLVAAHQLPPIKPWFTPEQTTEYWRKHESGAKAGVAIMLLSAVFYLPFTATLAIQTSRIPRIHAVVPALQLACGASGVFTYVIPALVLAVIPYRLERNPEITQMLTDAFYFQLIMPWPTFIVQNWVFAYAILRDPGPQTIFPRGMAFFNILAPIFYLPGNAMHTAKTGPLAWNGVLGFWFIGLVFCGQLIADSICLCFAIRSEGEEDMLLNLGPKKIDQLDMASSPETGNGAGVGLRVMGIYDQLV